MKHFNFDLMRRCFAFNDIGCEQTNDTVILQARNNMIPPIIRFQSHFTLYSLTLYCYVNLI